jgi:hypothetical protein
VLPNPGGFGQVGRRLGEGAWGDRGRSGGEVDEMEGEEEGMQEDGMQGNGGMNKLPSE